jgi:hypothetical protein
MKKWFSLLFLLFFAAYVSGQKKWKHPIVPEKRFEKTPTAFALRGGTIREASGIADSKFNKGFLWVEEDSGHPAELYLLAHDGTVSKTVTISGAENRDWEDMVLAAGPDDSKDYLYVADIGDNRHNYKDYTIYRFEEPQPGDINITSFDRIMFEYPDGSHDSEALLVDGLTKDIYVITKTEKRSRVYKIPYPPKHCR